jgi:hypothetical protein
VYKATLALVLFTAPLWAEPPALKLPVEVESVEYKQAARERVTPGGSNHSVPIQEEASWLILSIFDTTEDSKTLPASVLGGYSFCATATLSTVLTGGFVATAEQRKLSKAGRCGVALLSLADVSEKNGHSPQIQRMECAIVESMPHGRICADDAIRRELLDMNGTAEEELQFVNDGELVSLRSFKMSG